MRPSELTTEELNSVASELAKMYEFMNENCSQWFIELIQDHMDELESDIENELEERNDE